MLTKAAFTWPKIQKKKLYCEILLQFIILHLLQIDVLIGFKNVIYSCDGKAETSAAINPVLSVSDWSL